MLNLSEQNLIKNVFTHLCHKELVCSPFYPLGRAALVDYKGFLNGFALIRQEG